MASVVAAACAFEFTLLTLAKVSVTLRQAQGDKALSGRVYSCLWRTLHYGYRRFKSTLRSARTRRRR